MKPKVLIVEDDQPVLFVAVEILKRADCDVVAATTAREAIQRLEQDSFSLLITDFGLGEGTGEDVILALRKVQPAVPVIIVSGGVERIPTWLRDPGVVKHIFEKPFPPGKLLEAVTALLYPHSQDRLIPASASAGSAAPRPAPLQLPKNVEEMVHRVVDQESIVAITDKKGTIVYANDCFCEISGYSRSELIGQNHRLLKSGQHPPAFYKSLWGTILSGRVWRGEICNRAKDGRLYYVDTIISPLRSEGLITHFVALRTDITAKKEIEKALAEQQKQDEESRRMAALGRMANGFLHDLNNVLTGVMGIAAETSSVERDVLLHDAISRMAQLARTLRDYSTGRPSADEPFLLNPLLSCACSLVRHRHGVPAGLVIDEHLTGTRGVELSGNEAQIFEVVLNLVINAMEAASEEQKPRVVVSSEVEEGTIAIRVSDNGSGVPPEMAGSIFEPYMSSKGAGRGIGLSVSRSIAMAHGGDLKLLSAGGGGMGAVFQLSLPAGKVAAPAASDKEPVTGQRRVVLVSEDEADVRRLITRDAGQIGLTVMNAGDTADLLALAVQMKEVLAAAIIDSCEVDSEQGAVACLRRLMPELPIILISGKLTSQGRRATPWGDVESLPKPFDSRILIRTLSSKLPAISVVPVAGDGQP